MTNKELIDTCWNVNPYRMRIMHPFYPELIDTCWNVNQKFLCLTAWLI